MITLITAVPGSGKTLHAIELIDQFNKEKRAVFTNIDGLQKSKFDNPDLIYEAPADWRETPHGSVVIYDECQQPHLYPATAKAGSVDDERLKAMEVHRHTGHDLIFITQAPTFVHHHVRKLVGKHIHLYRSAGIKGAVRYEWSHTCDSPNDRREQERADSVIWKFPKQYFSYYKSATIHTHKFKIPTKLKWLLIFFIPFMSFILYRFNTSEIINPELAKPSEQQETSFTLNSTTSLSSLKTEVPDDSPFKWADNPPVSAVFGCVSTSNKCMCFNTDGSPLHLSTGACLSVINSPLPRRLGRGAEAHAQASARASRP